ncbi:MAG TPA: HAMP domain-containing sensor histidine kinase [Actinophytocola sp.]|nr:HAMP domain-containing sensor histidine kinase [Actinophytocola sp.]
MPWLSLRWRVAIAFGLVSLLLTGVLASVTWNLASGYMLAQREQSATRQAQVNARLVNASLRSDTEGIDDLLAGLSADAESTVLVERPGGWLTSGRSIDPAALPDSLLAASDAGEPGHERLVVQGLPVLAVALPLTNGARYVQLFPLSQLGRAFRFLSLVLLAGVAVSTLLAVGLGLWTSRRALRPLTQLTDAASRVARGDLAARLPEQADPDLAPLAAAFNRTAAALEARVQRDARFAGDVSHELRSPLTTMANAAAVLHRRRDELAGPARQALELLLAEVGHFQRMVVDLLEISRDDQLGGSLDTIETVDLTELVRAVVKGRVGDSTKVDAAESASVRGDRRRLDQVVRNLLDNADKHGGGPVRIGVLHQDGRIRVEVDDAGPGVPESHRERIFERFARGDGGRRGTTDGSGLGLALVAQHTGRHGGVAWVEPRAGGGARFVVELPEAVE